MTEVTKTAVRQGQDAVRETPAGKAVPELPTGRLTAALQDLAVAVAERALSSAIGKVEGMSGRLTDYAEGGGSNLLGAVTGAVTSSNHEAAICWRVYVRKPGIAGDLRRDVRHA